MRDKIEHAKAAYQSALERVTNKAPGIASGFPSADSVKAVAQSASGPASASPAAPSSSRRERRAVHGLGRVFQRGNVWWVSYYYRGVEQRESSLPDGGTRRAAETLLKKRLEEIGKGRKISPSEEARITVGDLLDALALSYKNDGRRSGDTLAYRLVPLREALGHFRAVDVRGSHVERYKAERRNGKKAPATVNRELAALRRAFKLAVEQERLTTAPTIKLFQEHNVREGFVTPADFETLLGKLPDYLQDFARFAFLTGWRKGELQTLAWSDVDRDGGTVTLRAEHSKNGEPRTLPLVGDLSALMERRWAAREVRGATETVTLATHVFHRAGEPVGDFRKAWATACEDANLPGLLFHDLRRSAVREMDRAGVAQTVAMKVTGHRTPSMWRRYRITSAEEGRDALTRTQGAIRAQRDQERNVVALRPVADGAGA